jgi:large subunit ribosomal protein L10
MASVEKGLLVNKMKDMYASASCVFIINYNKINADLMSSFRSELFKIGVKFVVLKNTLNKIAIGDTEFSIGKEKFIGQNGVIIANDMLTVAKVVDKFCEENKKKFKLVGLIYDRDIYDIKYVSKIAQLPSLDGLRSQLLSVMNSPGSRLLYLLQEPSSAFARALKEHSKD